MDSGHDDSRIDTVFKRQFKFYKKRFEEPDLSEILDLSVSNPHLGVVCHRLSTSNLIDEDFHFMQELGGFCPVEEWAISRLDHRPGLFILSGMLTEAFQLRWLEKCLLHYAEPPNVTNLSALGTYTDANVYRSCGEKLRWATMGNDYNWARKEYDNRPRAELPSEVTRFAALVARAVGAGEMRADAAILNFYPEKATLSPHVDISERDMTRPLVSLSLGQSAVYLTGGESLADTPVDALMLHSGDVLVMHAAQRRVYHAIPRILQTRRFVAREQVAPEVVDFANRCRFNMTIRQVDS